MIISQEEEKSRVYSKNQEDFLHTETSTTTTTAIKLFGRGNEKRNGNLAEF